MKDLNYWKENATENYMTTPISVLRYITELENKIEADISVTQCCTELKTFDIHECINEVSDEAQRLSFAVYDLKEDRSFRYGVKKAIDKMLCFTTCCIWCVAFRNALYTVLPIVRN